MISPRGPKQILVVDRVAVPVTAVCDAVIDCKSKTQVLNRLPINETEMFAAVDAMVNIVGISHQDYINFSCEKQEKDVAVETVTVTDSVYLAALLFGYEQKPNIDSLFALYAYGVESIMYDCLLDVDQQQHHFLNSDIHALVYESFCRAFGTPTDAEVKQLLESLVEEGIDK